jgi:hypothetical protein
LKPDSEEILAKSLLFFENLTKSQELLCLLSKIPNLFESLFRILLQYCALQQEENFKNIYNLWVFIDHFIISNDFLPILMKADFLKIIKNYLLFLSSEEFLSLKKFSNMKNLKNNKENENSHLENLTHRIRLFSIVIKALFEVILFDNKEKPNKIRVFLKSKYNSEIDENIILVDFQFVSELLESILNLIRGSDNSLHINIFEKISEIVHNMTKVLCVMYFII